MNRLIVAAMVLGGLLFLAGGDATGHGGVYRGPGDTVPPTDGPGPGTGGPNNGGPVTPGPGGVNTPGGTRGPVTPGAGPIGPGGGGSGPRAPITGQGLTGKRGGRGEGYEQWQFWWESNKDRYLDLRARLGENTVVSGSAGFLTGMGRKEPAATSRRPTADEVNRRLLPLLRGVLTEKDAEVVDSAVLAIGRTVRAGSAALVLEDIKQVLASEQDTPQQSAILALGVLGSRDAVPWLVEIMNDTPQGRKLLNRTGAIQTLQRSFAAVSLGFIGSPGTVALLEDCIGKNGNNEIDLRSSAILALGLFKEGKEDIVQYLVGLLRDKGLDRTTRAQIPITLGRLGKPAAVAVPQLLKEARSQTTDVRMQESCVIALGLLGNPEDREVLDALYGLIEEGRNQQARHFAFIALAQIGGRAAPDPEAHEELLNRLNRFLMKELASPKIKTHQPWAALALALLGRDYSETSHDRAQITAKVAEAFDSSNNAHYQSAFAIALGLLNATPYGETLYKRLLDTSDTNLKGYLAVSLGMMRYTRSLETLRNLVLDNRDEKMRLQVATALGLMADVEAVGTLIDGLRTTKTLRIVSSMASALGLIGDKSAIASLEEIITDRNLPGLTRGFACVAVGLIGEKTELPWNEPLSANANYRTVIPSLYEIVDIL
ncbi:MAG: HEAT repeat domain-containing protein [Planctomycetes bacterium]|nr:HEAT repeat domain-containing protein [Planctomycetota bacterium]